MSAAKQAQSCISKSDKLDFLRRRIDTLEETHRQFLRLRGQQATHARVLFVLGVVQDTALAFLEMAAQLVPGAGEKVALLGGVAINSAQSLSEVANGQGNNLDINIRTSESIQSLAGLAVKGPHREAILAASGWALSIGKVNVEAHRGKAAEASAQAKTASINMALDAVGLIAKHRFNNEGMAKVLAVAKAANTYSAAMNKRFMDLADAKWDAAEDLHTVEMKFKNDVRHLKKQLEEALALFEQECPDEAVIQEQIRQGRYLSFEPG
jgi:hypothetical protein